MARERKAWNERSPAQRARLERHGINESNYRNADMRNARGHSHTPEHLIAKTSAGRQKQETRYFQYMESKKVQGEDRASKYATKSRAERIGKNWPLDEDAYFWQAYREMMGI